MNCDFGQQTPDHDIGMLLVGHHGDKMTGEKNMVKKILCK
jgi:hypothetical protein